MSDINTLINEYKGKRIALYGLGTETERFLSEHKEDVSVAGLLDSCGPCHALALRICVPKRRRPRGRAFGNSGWAMPGLVRIRSATPRGTPHGPAGPLSRGLRARHLQRPGSSGMHAE